MASSEFKKYAQKNQWIHFPDEMVAFFQGKNEKPLVKFIQEGFDGPENIKKNQAKICFNADLVNRTASVGWHESLKILLTNECYIDQNPEIKNDRWDTLMWVLSCSVDHPKTARTVVDYMVNQVYFVDEYVAYEICSNHPQIWPGVSDLFPKSVQEQASGWALTGRRDYPEGNYEVILLSSLEQELGRISKKDTILKTKCFQQHIEGQYSQFKNCNLFDIARWAVMGNFREIFDIVEEIMSKKDPKRSGWVIDDLYQKSQHSENAIAWYKWKKLKIQLAYMHNTDVAHNLFDTIFPCKNYSSFIKNNVNISSYIDAGVELWQQNHDWSVIERIRSRSALLAEKILWQIDFNEFMQNHDGIFQHPHVCSIVHQRWANIHRSTRFFEDLFKKCTNTYQTSFVLHNSVSEEYLTQNTQDTLKKLKERQNAVPRPAGLFDTVISGFANPYSKKKI